MYKSGLVMEIEFRTAVSNTKMKDIINGSVICIAV